MKTNREKAIEYVNAMDIDMLDGMVVRRHDGSTHQWVECFPDGTVSETEEADNRTTHWINYSDKEVANIYDICKESAEHCNCDVCTMYEDFEDMDKDEFIERYSEDDWDYCNENSREEAILNFESDNGGLSGVDIREQMVDGIKGIEYGYFYDEDEV